MSGAALDSSVLVLNSSLVAVDIASVRRAFCLLFKAVAQVVDVSGGSYEFHGFDSWREVSDFKSKNGFGNDESEWVSTVSYELEVPRVIRLLTYDHYPQLHVSLNRRNLFARDESICQYCGCKFPTSELSVDHVLPLSQGGKTTWDNVVCACTSCNRRKGSHTPKGAGMKLIRRPGAPIRNPQIKLKIRRKKYYSWKHFLDDAYWSVALE